MPVSGSSAVLRFDLYRDSTPPGAPGPSGYIGLWLHKLAAADGLAWTGLFDGAAGDQAFASLLFDDGSVRSRTPAALTVDFDASATQATVRNELSWGTVKNIALDQFTGATLRVESFLDAFLDLDLNAVGQQVTLSKAQQGRVELGSGGDTLLIEAYTDRAGTGRTFFIDAGAGDDTVTVTPFAGLLRESWITVNAELGAGNDRFTGMGSSDSVRGGSGDDIAELRAGTNFFDGGAGYDTLILRGLKASYRIDDLGQGRWRLWDNQAAVDGDDGITTIWNVDKVVFKDQDWVLAPATGYNNPPTAGNDGGYVITSVRHFTFAELLANDSDPEGNPLSVIAVGDAVGGTVVRNWQTSTVTFTPTAGYSGPASFSYQVGDGRGGVAQATVSLSIGAAANTPPDAVNDAASTAEDSAVTVAVLANDTDADGNALTVTGVTNGAHGTVAINADGTLAYTPNANFNGADQFTYTVADGQGGSDTATVTVTVTPVNDAPVAVDDTATTVEDAAFALQIPVLANDSDSDGDPITVIGFTQGQNGTVTAGSNVAYLPNPGFSGTDSFTYTIIDAQGATATATVTVTVLPINDAPEAVDDVFNVRANETLSIAAPGFLANDTDADGDTVIAVSITDGVDHGTLTAFPNGDFTYTPNAGFVGTDSFSYQVSDGHGGTDTATVTINVLPAGNAAPVVVDDTFSTQERNPLLLSAPGLLGNDSDPDGDVLSITGYTQGAHGSVFVGADGSLAYQPFLGFVGTDSFTYTVSDGTDTTQGTVNVTVVEGTPIAAPDLVTTRHDTPLLIQASTLLANDSDPNGDALFIVGGNSTGTEGTVAILTGGNFQFTPAVGFVGTTSFTYSVTDGFNSAQATVTVNVTNDAPIVVGEQFTIQESNPLIVAAPGVLANDLDPDGDPLAVSQFTQGANGTVFVGADGSLAYQPLSGFVGTDSFTYTVSDGIATSSATVEVTVIEGTPIAGGDAVIAFRDTPLLIQASTLLANDSDPNGDALFIVGGNSTGTEGTVAILTGGNFQFTPAAGFVGTTSFIYSVTDGFNSAQATVTITVRPPNTVDAVDDSYVVTGTQLSVDVDQGLLANDSDADGDAFVVVAVDYAGTGQLYSADNGAFLYIPAAGFSGTESFTYTIRDALGAEDSATVTFTVPQPPPVANDDAFTVAEDSFLSSFAILANDWNPSGFPLTVAVIGGPAHGLATVQADGSVLYEPLSDFNGADSFTYRVTDVNGLSDTATVAITVTPVNDDPIALGGSFNGSEDTQLAGQLVAFDVDGDALTFSPVGAPLPGLVLNGNGSFTFDPPANASGLFVFNFQISDGHGGVITESAFLNIAAVNDEPIASPDGTAVLEGEDVLIDVLANDGDVDGDALTITGFAAGPAHGTVAIFANQVLYTPNPGTGGLVDSFTYIVSDGQGGTAQAAVTVDIVDVNQPPVANSDLVTTDEDTAITIAVLGNDSDDQAAPLAVSLVTGPANGSVVLNADGSFTYTPGADFNGDDVFVYRVTDAFGLTDDATVLVTVNPVNDAPVARDDVTATFEDFAILDGDVSPNDTDVDGDVLSFALVGAGPAGLAFNNDGTFTYAPPANVNGVVSFTYEASDGQGGSDTATVTITVIAVPDAPVAADDSAATAFETAVTIDVIGNDTDADGDALSPLLDTQAAHGTAVVNADGTITYTPVAGFSGTDSFRYRAFDGTGFGNVATVSVDVGQPGNRPPVASDSAFSEAEDFPGFLFSLAGLTNDPDNNATTWAITNVVGGSITGFDPASGLGSFVPTANFNGQARIDWTVSDAGGLSDSASIVVTVTPVNDAPVANADAYSVQEGRVLAVAGPGVLANDADIDAGDTVSALQYFQPANGTVNLNQDGSFTYTPNAGFSGVDSFVYVVTDGVDTGQSTVSITVVEGNPVVGADAYTTLHDRVLTIAAPGLLANDTDPNGDAIEALQYFQPTHGTVALNQDGSFTYTPDAGFTGSDSFDYVITDGVLTSQGTVTISVTNTAPVANDDSFSVQEGRALSISAPGLLANDSDADAGDQVSALQYFQPANGTVSLGQDGSFLYTPNAGFSGADSFVYLVTDGASTAQATVSITVVEGNPLVGDDSYTVAAGGSLNVPGPGVLANDSDPNGDAIEALQYFQPAHGTVSLNQDGSFTYSPNAGFSGTDSFTYVITDGVLTGQGSVTITVTPPGNNPPTANDDSYTTDEDSAYLAANTVNVTANDTDPEGNPLAISNVGVLGGVPVVAYAQNASTIAFYTTDSSYNGSFEITYTLSDGTNIDIGLLHVTVTPVNDPPRDLQGEDYGLGLTTAEDTPLVISLASLFADDIQPADELQVVTLYDLTPWFNGNVADNGDGTLTFTPNPDFTGTAGFYYRAQDEQGAAGNFVFVPITVTPVNDPVAAEDDAFVRATTPTQTLTRAQLIANDTDADNSNANQADDNVLTITSVSAISGGGVALNPDQSVTITFTGGPVRFSYTLSDGTTTDAATVTLNDAPVASDDAITIDENVGWTNYHFVDVVANDSDPNGDPLTITAVVPLNGAPIVADLVGNQVRFFVSDPSNNTNGTFQLQYTLSDGLGTDTGIVTITVTPENDPPRDPEGNDMALGLVTAEDTPLVVSLVALLADDANPPDEAQIATLYDVSNWVGGTIANNGNGTLTFTPAADFNGQAGFYYRAQDGQGAVGDYVWVPVSVTVVNDPLTANDDIIARQFQGGGTQTITRGQLVGNDVDVDNDGVITGASIVSGISSLVLNADQSVTVTYAAGAIPVFTYTLGDGTYSDSATVTLNSGPQVTGTPQAWVIDEDIYYYPVDDVLIALAGVTDPNGDNLFIRSFGAAPNLSVFDYFGEQAQIVGAPDFNGATTLTFTISDGNAVTDLTVTLAVTVNAQPDLPRDTAAASNGLIGYDGAFAGTEETPITISKAALMADDIDPDGGSLSWWTAYSYGYGSITDTGADIVFTPYANYAGELIGFYYYVQDSQGQFSDPIYVTVNLANTPDPITANDDVVQRTAGSSQVIAASAILGNDSDPDPGDSKTIVDLLANNGIDNVYLDAGSNVVVEYSAAGTGRASFIYTVQDSTGHTDTATVTLDRAPIGADDGPFTLDEGQNYVFIPYSALLANDSDPDGDTLFFTGWDWGYGGSNVYVSAGWFEGGEYGLRAYLYDTAYTGPAEFQYRASDGAAYSDIVTVTLDVVAGNDAPVAEVDYWYYNGAGYADADPLTNPMVGYEDGVITFPVSLLLDGQSYTGSPLYGADSDEEGDPISLVLASLTSPYGAVSVIDIGGVDHIQFTPNADVSSGDPWGGLDWSRMYFTYAVTDGQDQSNVTQAYLLVLPVNDLPVAQDDVFTVSGSGSWVLDIVSQYSAFDVRGNDYSADAYPYPIWDGTTIAGVSAVSGISSISWDGQNVSITGDGSGDPVVFEYTLQDVDGDTATAQVTLNPRQAAVYFSGSVPDSGRELWVYDPGSYDANLGSAFATMINVAELYGGLSDSTPVEITALGDSVFWRGVDASWHLYRPDLGRYDLNAVGFGDFDAALADEQANLGVRAGDYFWAANFDQLVAWDSIGGSHAYVYLPGYDRNTLSDAGHDPAFAATASTYDPVSDSFIDVEQLFVVLWNQNGGYYSAYQATGSADFGNDISEIAGLQVVEDPNNAGQYAKTLYFAGDYVDSFGIFHLDGLWKVTLTDTGSGWTEQQPAELIDNGSGALIASEARTLLVTEVPLGGTPVERLFWFQKDANGDDQIATRYDDVFAGSSVSSGSTFGPGYVGQEMIAYTNGVAFSAYDAGNDQSFLGSYIDSNFDGFFEVYGFTYDGVVEQLAADPASGRSAWVVDFGGYDTLYRATYFGTVEYVADVFGEITDVRFAGDQLVWIAPGANGSDTLFAYDYQSGTTLEVPTDEPSANSAGDGYTSGFANVAIAGGLVFEANTNGSDYQLWVTDGAQVLSPGNGTYRFSEGAVLNGDWVGTAYVGDYGSYGLYSIAGDSSVTQLYANPSANVLAEAEVLGQQVLFGISSATVNQVLVYDTATATTTPVLFDHLLGAANTVGSNIIFSALDFSKPVNSDADTANNAWTLYAYDGTSATALLDLPTGGGGGQHVYEWTGHADFLGDDSRIFWKQANDTTGVELHTIDLSAADPSSTLAIVDVWPGVESGTNWGDAEFANGRLYWQASDDGSTNHMRLWTTTDGTDAQEVTGADLSTGNPYQFPWLPQAIGDEVFFLANSAVSNTWGVFQVNDDGVTASMISPASSPYIYGLSAVGGDLYYFTSDGVAADQMYRLTPGATPGAAGAPVALTSFTQPGGFMSDIFQGGDGNLYFRRDEDTTGSELWVLDANEPTGARLVADLNTQQAQGGYAPQQLTPVPDPLEQWLAGTFQPGGAAAAAAIFA